MKIADPVLSSLFVKDNEKCNISHAPSNGFKSGIQFSILNVLKSLITRLEQNITTLFTTFGQFLRTFQDKFCF